MTVTPSRRLRMKLATAAAGPALLAAVVVAFPSESPVFPLAIGSVAALIAGAAVWWLTKPLGELARLAPSLADGHLPKPLPTGRDEVAAVADALTRLEARRRDTADERDLLGEAFRATLVQTADAVADIQANAATAEPPKLTTPFAAEQDALIAALAALQKAYRTARQQATDTLRVLQELPLPVFVTDAQGKVRFLNATGEELFGCDKRGWAQKPLATWIHAGHDPHANGSITRNLDVVTFDADGHAAGRARIASGEEIPIDLYSASANSSANSGVIRRTGGRVILVADARRSQRRAAESARAAREAAVGECLARALAETEAPARDAAQVLRWVIQEVKQSGQRDRLVPKLRGLYEQAIQLGVYARTIDWLRRAMWGELPEQTPGEFMAAEAVRGVRDQIAARLKSRNNEVQIRDEGGWLLCDADWLQTLLGGLMLHACEATSGGKIDVRIGRQFADHRTPLDRVTIEILDAGPALPAALLARLHEPFAGPDPLPLDAIEEIGGFPLGLLLASQLIGRLDGTLSFESSPAKLLTIRVSLPSRLDGPAEMVRTDELDDGETVIAAPEPETVAGWRLGYAN